MDNDYFQTILKAKRFNRGKDEEEELYEMDKLQVDPEDMQELTSAYEGMEENLRSARRRIEKLTRENNRLRKIRDCELYYVDELQFLADDLQRVFGQEYSAEYVAGHVQKQIIAIISHRLKENLGS
ncbi:unnamed protein product [marine sediment metagenome]|uniref:Uncharacterized protein n=1 Tax=marine sediment metagenome TaxID=412755 RepID=X0ZH44_9ZZZZ